MSELDYDDELMKLKMWNEYSQKVAATNIICSKCKNIDITKCYCAKDRFIESVKDENIYQYLEKKLIS